jgi:hypothetical protein
VQRILSHQLAVRQIKEAEGSGGWCRMNQRFTHFRKTFRTDSSFCTKKIRFRCTENLKKKKTKKKLNTKRSGLQDAAQAFQ